MSTEIQLKIIIIMNHYRFSMYTNESLCACVCIHTRKFAYKKKRKRHTHTFAISTVFEFHGDDH